MNTVGIDVGSKTVKAVLLRDGAVAARALATGGFEPSEVARSLYEKILAEGGLSPADIAHVTATGMGRGAVDFARSTVTDITAAARAAAHYFPGRATVIEVGAEESRAVRTDGAGKVLDSAVNEKCAAGTGSFTESMARALGLTLEEFGGAAIASIRRIPMNAQCTVFAESEVVSLIHQNVDKADIARAVLDAIASRVSAMARRVRPEPEAVFLGGLALNPGFCAALREHLGLTALHIPDHPEYADAVGAALVAAERAGAGGKP